MVLHTPFQIFNSPATGLINKLEFQVSNAQSPKYTDDSNWQPISLPDDWSINHSHIEQLWYRAKLILGQSTENIWAIYLPSVTHNAAVYINGVWIGQGGEFTDPLSRNHNLPLMFSFSSKLLQQGVNQIDIRVKAAFYEQGLMDQFYLAPQSQLYSAYYWKHLIRIDLVKWMTLAMYILSVMIFSFWLARPQDIVYILFSAELFVWATHNLNLFMADIPVSAKNWEAMTIVTLGWTVTLMILFNHRFVGDINRKVEKVTIVFSVLGIGIFLLPDIESVLHIGYRIWDVFVMVFGLYAIYHLINIYRKQYNIDVFLMLLAGIPILVFGFHDILMINHFIDRRDGLIMQYSVIPSVLLFSWFLVRRFVQSINRAEQLASTLEQRVQDKQHELKQQYEKLSLLEKQNVLSEERERIMRDMHDGIGGQLVTIVSMLQEQSGDIFSTIREKIKQSLTDLRFVIDSLDPLLSDLPTMLGMMRLRLLDQLEVANIELEWGVTDLPEIKDMSPRCCLHIMRIVQEGITNSIKHSNSQKMKLATGILDASSQTLYIDVIDYGQPFNPENLKTGRGIKNMYYRAAQINSCLDITSGAEGTRVRLVLSYKS